MKWTLMAGVLAVALWGQSARAQEIEIEEEEVVTRREARRPITPEEERLKFLEDRFQVTAGGGVEGYTGTLADRLNVGPMWGATLGYQPLRWMSAEVGYSGATTNIDEGFAPGLGTDGADVVRNGGQVAVSFNVPTPIVQPYALAGIGLDRYTVRATETETFKDDTSGRVPLGAGVRAQVGAFAADARFHYDLLFSQQFARATEAEDIGGAYTGLLQVGARF